MSRFMIQQHYQAVLRCANRSQNWGRLATGCSVMVAVSAVCSIVLSGWWGLGVLASLALTKMASRQQDNWLERSKRNHEALRAMMAFQGEEAQ